MTPSPERKTGNSGRLIYQPAGAAREYAPLALNLWAGCPHRCAYCYVPGCLRCSAEEFAARAGKPRAGFEPDGPGWKKLNREAAELDVRRLRGEVLLSFTSDPYQEAEKELHLTRQALRLLSLHFRPGSVLTKRPALAFALDADLFRAGAFRLATTVTGLGADWRDRWEPGCEETGELRLQALTHARAFGIPTWVSLEPVIDPAEALAVLARIGELFGSGADIPVGQPDGRHECLPHFQIKIGKLNHHDHDWVAGIELAATGHAQHGRPKWDVFCAQAAEVCAKHGVEVYWKESLRPYLPE